MVSNWRPSKPARRLPLPRQAVGSEEEQRRQAALNKEASDARGQIAAASVVTGAADTAGDQLHVEAEKFATTACGEPGTEISLSHLSFQSTCCGVPLCSY